MEPDHMNDQAFLMMYDEVIGAREAPLLIPDQVLTQKGKIIILSINSERLTATKIII
jgi:hypothetical protein